MEELVKVISDWQNYMKNKMPNDRVVLNEIKLDSKEVIDILGCRRVGKSTMFKLIIDKLKLSENEYLYINFEDPFFIENSSSNIFEQIIETFKIYFSKDLKYLFLDEVQHIQNWERAVRKLRDFENYHIFISGSSSKLLSKELGSSLTGRHISNIIYPLSFREFLDFRGVKFKSKKDVLINRIMFEKYFNEYLELGGFPEVVVNNNLDLLKNYFYDILYKDIVARYEIRDTSNLEKIAYYVLTNFTNKISLQSLRSNYGLSFDKLRNYLSYLVETYLIYEVKQFSFSIKKQENLPKKYYLIDNGFIKSIAFKFSQDFGRLLENLVFMEFKRRGKDVYFYVTKNGYEVDFLSKSDLNSFDIFQVVYDFDNLKTKEREIRALVDAAKELNCKSGTLITKSHKERMVFDDIEINCIPIVDWLLL